MRTAKIIQFPVLKRYVGPETAKLITTIVESSGLPVTATTLAEAAKNFLSANLDLAKAGLPPLFDPTA